jgi:hypothetical protein
MIESKSTDICEEDENETTNGEQQQNLLVTMEPRQQVTRQ